MGSLGFEAALAVCPAAAQAYSKYCGERAPPLSNSLRSFVAVLGSNRSFGLSEVSGLE
jgi:hypothetical protein